MSQKSSTSKPPAETLVRDIRRATRRHYSAEDKIRIVLEGLREDGHAVAAVGNGTDALALALAGEFDAIIRDVMLPGLASRRC